jgi:hypothetical protein
MQTSSSAGVAVARIPYVLLYWFRAFVGDILDTRSIPLDVRAHFNVWRQRNFDHDNTAAVQAETLWKMLNRDNALGKPGDTVFADSIAEQFLKKWLDIMDLLIERTVLPSKPTQKQQRVSVQQEPTPEELDNGGETMGTVTAPKRPNVVAPTSVPTKKPVVDMQQQPPSDSDDTVVIDAKSSVQSSNVGKSPPKDAVEAAVQARQNELASAHNSTASKLPTPAPKTDVKPQEKLPTPKPDVKPQEKLPTPKPDVKPQEKLPTPKLDVKPQEKLPTPSSLKRPVVENPVEKPQPPTTDNVDVTAPPPPPPLMPQEVDNSVVPPPPPPPSQNNPSGPPPPPPPSSMKAPPPPPPSSAKKAPAKAPAKKAPAKTPAQKPPVAKLSLMDEMTKRSAEQAARREAAQKEKDRLAAEGIKPAESLTKPTPKNDKLPGMFGGDPEIERKFASRRAAVADDDEDEDEDKDDWNTGASISMTIAMCMDLMYNHPLSTSSAQK